ncbi:MAG: SLBB domain-containing protein [Verrucomicrobiaceae bacterium]|nr:SLBB domain-containing protein [Verrucomicrobiaceae bacterium]
MKAHIFLVTSCLVAVGSALSQDPTFRLPETRRSSEAAAPTIAPGETLKSASVINDMNVVDNSTPIRAGDLISLRIVEDRKDAIQLRVGVTGDINAPHIGLVRAAGRTCRELAFSMKGQLEKSLYNTATVIVAIDQRPEDIGARRPGIGTREEELDVITVFGQVIRQGKYELPTNEDMTISQAILLSGGFAQFANPKKVKLVRKTPQGNKTILVNVDQIMRRGNLDKDIFLRRGDVIIVDEKTVNF